MDITAAIMSNASIFPPYWGVIGGDLPSNARQSISYEDQTIQCILTLSNLSPSDDGNYTITATNVYGTSVAYAYIKVDKSVLLPQWI